MAEDSRVKAERNRVDKLKNSEEKEERRYSDQEVDYCCCWKKFVIRKCIYLYLHSADDDHDEVAMYLLTYHQQAN